MSKDATAKQELTQYRLRQVLNYDAATGSFTWLLALGKRARVGMLAGTVNSHGYMVIMINGKSYPAHRLAWLYTTGEWPGTDIDHVNRNRADNRLSNLRLASRIQNSGNQSISRNNTSGAKGVYLDKHRRKWVASIRVGRKLHYLGRFNTVEDATSAYAEAARHHFGEFAHVAVSAGRAVR